MATIQTVVLFNLEGSECVVNACDAPALIQAGTHFNTLEEVPQTETTAKAEAES